MNWKTPKRYRNNEDEENSHSNPIYLSLPSTGNDNISYPQASIRVLDNKVFFYGDIDEESSLDLNKVLIETDIKLQNTRNTLGDEYKPIIHLHLNTYGGEVYPALATVNLMKTLKTDIYTYLDGSVASAGTLISTVGKKRFAYKYSYLLIHQLSGGMYGKFSEMEDDFYNSSNLMKMFKTFYKDHTKIPMKKLDEILKRDIWFSAEECLQYGIIDEIL